MAKAKYTEQELADFKRADLIADAEFAERQAAEGPFYPDRGITAESLLAYAAKCRAEAAQDWKSVKDHVGELFRSIESGQGG